MASGILKALTQNSAETHRAADDPRLRGRTYHIPFATVWDQILEAIEIQPRWDLIHADEVSGLIRAEATTRWLGFTDDVRLRVTLDDFALTRVDMRSSSRVGRGDFGLNRRRIARFFNELDRRLQRNG